MMVTIEDCKFKRGSIVSVKHRKYMIVELRVLNLPSITGYTGTLRALDAHGRLTSKCKPFYNYEYDSIQVVTY